MVLVSHTEAGPALADGLVDVMSAVRRAVKRETGAVAEVASLTGAQLQLVRVVRRHPDVSVAEAAGELGLAPNTVSTLVHQLVAAGVLERRVGAADRRVAHLFLCPEVAHGLGQWVGRRSDAVAEALAHLAEADRQALTDALAPLARLALAIGRKGDGEMSSPR
jgi:DNA-binding MarR family transcriptional regulator